MTTPDPRLLPHLDESGMERVLCVVAHPDDMEYGAAAAVARWTSRGVDVRYVLVTSGEAGIDGLAPDLAGPLREQEERDGAAEVGVHVVEFLGHRDGVVEYGVPLRRDIARAIRTHRPDTLVAMTARERFAGGGVNQADHRAVGLAALDAAKDAGTNAKAMTTKSTATKEVIEDTTTAWRFVKGSGALVTAIRTEERSQSLPPRLSSSGRVPGCHCDCPTARR